MTQGILPGFLIGQAFNGAGAPSSDRTGAPLSFTRAVKSVEVGANLEVTGIRVEHLSIILQGEDSNNDYVYFRIADVILMKAEAILRGGTATANWLLLVVATQHSDRSTTCVDIASEGALAWVL